MERPPIQDAFEQHLERLDLEEQARRRRALLRQAAHADERAVQDMIIDAAVPDEPGDADEGAGAQRPHASAYFRSPGRRRDMRANTLEDELRVMDPHLTDEERERLIEIQLRAEGHAQDPAINLRPKAKARPGRRARELR
jgi:hypothetical protein